MKNYKSLILIVFLSIFAINVKAEVLILSEEDKESAVVYLIKDPTKGNPVFVTDIDNNLTISEKNNNVLAGKIESDACLLTDLNQITRSDMRNWNKDRMPFYDVATMYEAYGIFNLSTILANDSEKDLENFANSLGLEIKVETVCKYGKTGNTARANFYSGDVFFISEYLHNEMLQDSKLLQSITAEDVLGSWTFDEIKTLSDNYLTVVAEKEKFDNEFKQKYANLAQEKSKEFVGSLYINLNSNGRQKFCTLGYSDSDAVAVIGYRLMGDEIIIDESLKSYYDSKEISLNYSKNENQFENSFDDIGEAFSNIKSSLEANEDDYCNIFIDYPENLVKLKNAIERDLEWKTVLGALFNESVTDKQYAIGQGFDDYEQYNFAYQIDADYKDVKSLKNYQIINLIEFNKVQDQILSIGYSNYTNISNVLIYLDDLSNAQKQNMDVNEYRDARVKEEKRLEEIARLAEAKRQAEFAKEYPYTAILTCGMGGGDHINIVACFSGGSSGVDTELEITNGQNYQMYKTYNLRSAGNEYRSGFEINLKDSFTIIAQNSSKYLLLSLEIIDNETGMKLYEQSASQYGLVNYRKYWILSLIFLALWAFSLFYGTSLIRTDQRKLGIRYLIIFSVPLGIFTLAFWLMDYEYLNFMLNGSSEMMDTC